MENFIPMDDLGIPPILGNPHAQIGQSDEFAEMRQLALAPSKPGEKCAVAVAVHVDTCPSGDTLISSIALIEHIYIYIMRIKPFTFHSTQATPIIHPHFDSVNFYRT